MAIAPRPTPRAIASVSSESISPACLATMVAPTISSPLWRTRTFTKPDTSPSTTLYNDYELDDPLKLAAIEETRLFFAELLRAE